MLAILFTTDPIRLEIFLSMKPLALVAVINMKKKNLESNEGPMQINPLKVEKMLEYGHIM